MLQSSAPGRWGGRTWATRPRGHSRRGGTGPPTDRQAKAGPNAGRSARANRRMGARGGEERDRGANGRVGGVVRGGMGVGREQGRRGLGEGLGVGGGVEGREGGGAAVGQGGEAVEIGVREGEVAEKPGHGRDTELDGNFCK